MMTKISGKSRVAKVSRATLALAAVLMLGAGDAFARAGKGGSFGSRGSQSKSAPPPTNTAPRQAQPLPGSLGQQGMASSVARQAPAGASRWGTGLMGGLMGGLLGAGLFGLLSGSGFLSGLGSFMGFLGLLLQVALVAIVVKLGLNWWRNRQAKPAMAGGEPMARQPMQPDWAPQPASLGAAPAAAPAIAPLEIGGDDFAMFQQRLTDVQEAYGRGDRIALSRLTTSEMANRFNEELDHDARQNAANRLSDVTLLQGDLAEAWREDGAEYATVAMRYSLIDVTIDKASGKVIAGDPAKPQEATEIWTFVRDPGAKSDSWMLSAIQQA